MKKYLVAASLVMTAPAAFANLYVSGKVGVTDFVVDSYQFMYYSPKAARSTISDGTISDINASYHAALGYAFSDMFRIDAEYGYGRYVMSGNWDLNTPNLVPGALPPNLSYPSTYILTDKVHTFSLNGYFNMFTFDRRFKSGIYNRPKDVRYDAMYVVVTAGMMHLRERGQVGINTTMAWGGNALSEDSSMSLNRFMYGVGLGLSFGLTDDVSLTLEYKYLRLGNYDSDLVRRDYSSHNILMGLRYEF